MHGITLSLVVVLAALQSSDSRFLDQVNSKSREILTPRFKPTYICRDHVDYRSPDNGLSCEALAKRDGFCSNPVSHYIVDNFCPQSCGRCRILEAIEQNVTTCCELRGVPAECNFCSFYDPTRAISKYSLDCVLKYMPTLLSCALGGVDHTPCCAQHNVPTQCLKFCSPTTLPNSLTKADADCLDFQLPIGRCITNEY